MISLSRGGTARSDTGRGPLPTRTHTGPTLACGQINIGNAATEMATKLADGALQANGTAAPEPLMDVECVARAVPHMASLPPEANILLLAVMTAKMPFVGRN